MEEARPLLGQGWNTKIEKAGVGARDKMGVSSRWPGTEGWWSRGNLEWLEPRTPWLTVMTTSAAAALGCYMVHKRT